jgi:hypothetical protein
LTFRKPLTAIEATNGVVHVEPGSCGHGVRACLKIWMEVSRDRAPREERLETAFHAVGYAIAKDLTSIGSGIILTLDQHHR